MASWQFWQHTGWGLFRLVGQMILIIIPLTVFLEVMKDLNIFNRLTRMLHWTVRPFGMPQAAVFPLLVGLFFGIAYGAGFIIEASEEGGLSKRDLYLISLFLVINHSAVDDTLLFVAVGAKGWVVLAFRFAASIVITWAVSRFLKPLEHQGPHWPKVHSG